MFQIPSIFRREASGDSERGAPVHPPDRIHVCPDRPSTQEIPTFGGGVSQILMSALIAQVPRRFPLLEGGSLGSLASAALSPRADGVCTYGSGGQLRGSVICFKFNTQTSAVVPRSDSATCSSTVPFYPLPCSPRCPFPPPPWFGRGACHV